MCPKSVQLMIILPVLALIIRKSRALKFCTNLCGMQRTLICFSIEYTIEMQVHPHHSDPTVGKSSHQCCDDTVELYIKNIDQWLFQTLILLQRVVLDRILKVTIQPSLPSFKIVPVHEIIC